MKHIDETKCMGCRKGINTFVIHEGDLYHLDLFATPEAGEHSKCMNEEVLKPLMMEANPDAKNEDGEYKGLYIIRDKKVEKELIKLEEKWNTIVETLESKFEGDWTAVNEYASENDLLTKSSDKILKIIRDETGITNN